MQRPRENTSNPTRTHHTAAQPWHSEENSFQEEGKGGTDLGDAPLEARHRALELARLFPQGRDRLQIGAHLRRRAEKQTMPDTRRTREGATQGFLNNNFVRPTRT